MEPDEGDMKYEQETLPQTCECISEENTRGEGYPKLEKYPNPICRLQSINFSQNVQYSMYLFSINTFLFNSKTH